MRTHRWGKLVGLIVILSVWALPRAAAEQPPGLAPDAVSITEYPTLGTTPQGIAAGPDGAVWYTLADAIERIAPNGTVTRFALAANSGPSRITAGPDGALWFSQVTSNRIGRITTAGAVTKFPIPTPNSEPHSIVLGPDGALWFVERLGNKVGRITTAGVITEYPMPTPGTDALGIAVGSDGALWYASRAGNRIGRVTTGGAITDYPIPTPNAGAFFIARGPDGDLWFNESAANKIGRIRYRPDVDLSISKEASLSQALPGQPISFTIIYRNSGLEPAASVRITDTVPLALANLSFSSSRPITAVPGLRFAWDAGTLAPNASGVITVTGIVSPNLTADLAITNTVRIDTSANDVQPGNNSAQAALRIAVPRVSAASATVDEGGRASLRVSLAPANPFAAAAVAYASADGSAAANSDYLPVSGTLAFPAGTTALTVTLDTVEDRLDEPDETASLILQPVRGVALGAAPATVTIVDDDAAAVLVAQAGPLITTEDGGTASFTVRLDSQPFSPVTIPVSVSDSSEAQLSTTALIFTASTWDQPQQVTVTGLDDTLRDGNVAYQVVLGQAVSGDPAYAAINPPDLAAVNLDNEGYVVYAPLALKAAPIPTLPVRLAPELGILPVTQQGAVFYQAVATVRYDGGPVLLAGNAAGTAPSCVDDRMTLVVTRPDGTERTFSYQCLAPGQPPAPLPPTDFSSYLQPGVNTIAIEYRDVFGSVTSATELWLAR